MRFKIASSVGAENKACTRVYYTALLQGINQVCNKLLDAVLLVIKLQKKKKKKKRDLPFFITL